MPDAALETILRHANRRFARILRFLRFTGCRAGEACGLTWGNVDLELGVCTFPTHKSKKHTGKAKQIVLLPEAVAILREIRGRLPAACAVANLHVFVNCRSRPYNRGSLCLAMSRLKHRHQVDTPATLHGLRHQFASVAIAAGAPLKLISMQLGHSSSAITEKYYLHLAGQLEAIRAAAAFALPPKPSTTVVG
jgi:integrase